MVTSRWWLVALGVAATTAVVVLAFVESSPVRLGVGVGIVAAYVAAFLALRPRVREGNAWAWALAIATILFVGSLTALQPQLALTQFIAYPLVWVVSAGRRSAIVASAGIAVAVGIGFLVSLGTSPAALIQTAITQSLSFGFSTIMGLWISQIASLGEEKQRLLDELTDAQDALAAMHRDAGVTEERARMAREVHDTVAQSLTGLVLLGQRARRALAGGTLDDETLELIESGARDALAETRALVAAAAPVELAHGGIADALATLGERFERETRIRVTTSVELPSALPRDAEVVFLRCAQEGLANVRKHSDAASARVELRLDGATARLQVADDGRGFPDDWTPGFGLAGLRDRLALAGGELAFTSQPGRTVLTATLPIGGEP